MVIQINPTKKISEFQNEFIAFFPFLKIEFFMKSHEVGASSSSNDMYFNRTMTMGDIGNVQADSAFEFTPQMRIDVFEQGLWKQYGLAVQVFCKSMDTYVETTSSDSLTLEAENKNGEIAVHGNTNFASK
jgi:hypothetical protein